MSHSPIKARVCLAVFNALSLLTFGACRFDARIPSTKAPDSNSLPSPSPTPGRTASLSISDAVTYDYGTLTVGNSSDKLFTVTNTGDGSAMTMTGSFSGLDLTYKGGSYPGTGGTCSGTLTAVANCTVVVRFVPQSSGVKTDTLLISYNNGTSTTSASRALTGTGMSTASLSISDLGYDYGNVSSLLSADKNFTITNSGETSATGMSANAFTNFTNYAFVGGTYPGTGGDCTATLSGSGTCTIAVRFTPGGVGVVGDTISIAYSTGVSTTTATRVVTGTGVFWGPSGAFDTSFYTGGLMTRDLSPASSDIAKAIISQTDGKLIVGGQQDTGDLNLLARFTTNGGLDTSFNSVGTKIHGLFSNGKGQTLDLALDTAGAVYAAVDDYDGAYAGLIRYFNNGTMDTTFGTSGIALVTFPTAVRGASAAIQTDGKFIFQSLTQGAPVGRLVTRILSNGILDTTFSTDGVIIATCPSDSAAPPSGTIGKVRLDTAGRAVSIGYELAGTVSQTTLLRVTTDGRLDTAFGTTGKLATLLLTQGYALAFDTLGKIAAAGGDDFGGGPRFAVMRFMSDGAVDTTFNTSGKYTYGGVGQATAIVTVGDRVVASSISSGSGPFTFRLLGNGNLDTSFGTDGIVYSAAFGATTNGWGIAVQSTTQDFCGVSYTGASTSVACFSP